MPAAASTLAGSGAAFLWGMLMDRMGRRQSLVLGLVFGAAGAVLCIWGITAGSFLLFLVGMMLVGVANAAVTLSRFVAAEVQTPERRGRAVSTVVLGGTVGAIGGPLLVNPAGRIAMQCRDGRPGRGLRRGGAPAAGGRRGGGRAAAPRAADTLSTALLTAGPSRGTPPHLADPAASRCRRRRCRHGVQPGGDGRAHGDHLPVHEGHAPRPGGRVHRLLRAHYRDVRVLPASRARLIDRWGRRPVIILGACVLLLACLTAPLTGDTIPISVSLLLLGLGWNFCFVGGSTLLADHLNRAERGRTQGFNDLLVGLAAALGSLGSGLIAARFGYAGVGMAGAVLTLLPFVFVARWARAARRQPSV